MQSFRARYQLMSIDRVTNLLTLCDSSERRFPATDLYNEGWMLRVILDWFASHRDVDHELAISNGASWYSEALLPSQFLSRVRGDPLGESWTHADGVIGDFLIGESGDGDLKLKNNPGQFVVTEAKMFSKLSAGVTRAKYYNQAARNVACIAEVIYRAGMSPANLESIGFYVVAPEVRIKEGIFEKYMETDSIRSTVQRRVEEYGEPEKEKWYLEQFLPLLDVIDVRQIAWEEIVEFIAGVDETNGMLFKDFYNKCLKYNQSVAKRYAL